jgi:hypothetical protein
MSKSSQVELIVAKIESTYGIDSGPTAALNAIKAANSQLTPYDAQTATLDYKKPSFGNNQQIVVDENMRLTFDVYISGSGEPGTAPPVGALLRGCGWAETLLPGISAMYNPVSTGHESLTIWVYKDGILHKGTGCRGTFTWDITAKQVPKFSFDFTGNFQPVEDAAMPAGTNWDLWKDPRAAIPTFTGDISMFGYDAMKVKSYTGDTQTDVQTPDWVNHREIVIADRLPTVQCEIEALPMVELNVYDLIQKQTHGSIKYTHGNEPGNTIVFEHPDAIITAATYGDNAKILTNQITIIPLIKEGNDDMAITFM